MANADPFAAPEYHSSPAAASAPAADPFASADYAKPDAVPAESTPAPKTTPAAEEAHTPELSKLVTDEPPQDLNAPAYHTLQGPQVARDQYPSSQQQLKDLFKQPDVADRMGASMLKNAPKLNDYINKGSTLLEKPRLPEGSPQAPQNQPEAMEGVHPYQAEASYWQNARNLANNAANDLGDAYRVSQAIPNALAERNQENRPVAQGGMGRHWGDAQDINGLVQGSAAAYNDLHNKYLGAHYKDVLKQAFNHPLGTAVDVATTTNAGLKAPKLLGKGLVRGAKAAAKAADKVIEEGLFKAGGGFHGAKELTGLVDYRNFKGDLLARTKRLAEQLDFGNLYKGHVARKMLDKALEAADKHYLTAIGPLLDKIEQMAEEIPAELRQRLMAGAEWTDEALARQIRFMPQVQKFLNFNDKLWHSFETYLDYSPEQELVARYGPPLLAKLRAVGVHQSMGGFYNGGNPAKGISPHAIAGLTKLKGQMEAAGEKPHYNAILTKKHVQKVFDTYRDSFKLKGRTEATHFQANRNGKLYAAVKHALSAEEIDDALKATPGNQGTIKAPPKPSAAPADASLRDVKVHEMDIVRNTQAAASEALRIKMLTDALQKMVDNPKYPPSYKYGISEYAKKRFGVTIKLLTQDLPGNKVESAWFKLAETLKMPAGVSGYLDTLLQHRGTDVLSKAFGQLLSWHKISILGSDPIRLAKQFPQALMFYGMATMKTPKDVARGFLACLLATNPKMADGFMKEVNKAHALVAKEPGVIASIRDHWRNNPNFVARACTPVYAFGRVLKANTDFVNRADDFARVMTGAHLALQEFDKMPAGSVKFWDGAFHISAAAQEHLEAIVTNPETANRFANHVNTYLGEYARQTSGIQKAIRDNIYWYPWIVHSTGLVAVSAAQDDLRMAVCANAMRHFANDAQDRSAMNEQDYRRGAVAAKGTGGKPLLDPNGDPLLYKSAGTLNPFGTGLSTVHDFLSFALRVSNGEKIDPVEYEERSELQPNPIIQTFIVFGQELRPDIFERPHHPDYWYDDKGHAFKRSELAKGNVKEEVEPVPNLGASLGRIWGTRLYTNALDAWEGSQGGKPSQFSEVGTVHAPKMRHETAEEQGQAMAKAKAEGRTPTAADALTKVKPMTRPQELANFIWYETTKSFQPSPSSITRETDESMKESRARAATKAVQHQWIPKDAPKEGVPYKP